MLAAEAMILSLAIAWVLVSMVFILGLAFMASRPVPPMDDSCLIPLERMPRSEPEPAHSNLPPQPVFASRSL
jgi:hypothetical protein